MEFLFLLFCPAQFQLPGPGVRKGETALPYPLPPGPCPAQESPLGLAKCVKKLGPCASDQAQRSFYDAQPASVFHPEPLQALSGPGGPILLLSLEPFPETLLSGRPWPWLACLWGKCGRPGRIVCARTSCLCACVCRATPPPPSGRDGLLLPRFWRECVHCSHALGQWACYF